MGLLGILCWGILFPVMLGVIIGRQFSKRNNWKAYSMKMNERNYNENSVLFEEKKNRFSFFFKDYKRKFYYWECIIFLKKFILGLLPSITQIVGDENIDLIFVSFMFFYFSAVSKFFPYRIPKLNILESVSTITTIFSRFAIICMNSDPNNFVLVVSFSLAFISMNSLFFILALYYLVRYNDWKAFFSYYKDKYKRMKHMIEVLPKISRISLLLSKNAIKNDLSVIKSSSKDSANISKGKRSLTFNT